MKKEATKVKKATNRFLILIVAVSVILYVTFELLFV
jgi:hypothetical protein